MVFSEEQIRLATDKYFYELKSQEAICEELENANMSNIARNLDVQTQLPKKAQKQPDEVDLAQMSLFDTVKDDDVLEEIKNLDVSHLTPIDALNTLYQLQNKLKNRW